MGAAKKKEAAHYTPGPWVLSQNGDDFAVHGGWNNELLVTEMPANGHPRDPYVEADATLIAAAPELLEALQEIRQCLNAITVPGEFKDVLDRSRAVIAKAKGEA